MRSRENRKGMSRLMIMFRTVMESLSSGRVNFTRKVPTFPDSSQVVKWERGVSFSNCMFTVLYRYSRWVSSVISTITLADLV